MLNEPEPRACSPEALDLDRLVGEGADDRAPEAALAHLVRLRRRVQLEPLALVDDLDRDAVVDDLVQDLHLPLESVVVSVADGVRTRFSECELEIVQRLVREWAVVRDPGERESTKRDVFRFRGNRQPDRSCFGAHRTQTLLELGRYAQSSLGWAGRSASFTGMFFRSPPRTIANVAVEPGSRRWPTSRTTSLPLRTRWPSIATMTSPPPTT